MAYFWIACFYAPPHKPNHQMQQEQTNLVGIWNVKECPDINKCTWLSM